jgi:hypothetical protein
MAEKNGLKYHCANCREDKSGDLDLKQIKRTAVGEGRTLIFCEACNCFLKLEETNAAAKQ